MHRLVMVRHGESTWNQSHQIQGASNVPLSDTGYAQAARVAQRLASESIVARSMALLDDLNQQHPGDESVLLVAHGQILRMLICVLLDIDPSRFLSFAMGNTSISELRYTPDGVVLHRLNDTTHLHPTTQE